MPDQFNSELIVCVFPLKENGLLFVPKGQGQNPQAQMFSDPNMAMDMMKKNLSMIIPQVLKLEFDSALALDFGSCSCTFFPIIRRCLTGFYLCCFLFSHRLLLLLG